jgi:hypothetical protein
MHLGVTKQKNCTIKTMIRKLFGYQTLLPLLLSGQGFAIPGSLMVRSIQIRRRAQDTEIEFS